MDAWPQGGCLNPRSEASLDVLHQAWVSWTLGSNDVFLGIAGYLAVLLRAELTGPAGAPPAGPVECTPVFVWVFFATVVVLLLEGRRAQICRVDE